MKFADTTTSLGWEAFPQKPSPRVAALVDRMRRNRGRLIFALDATASRESTWDLAAQLTGALFEEAAKIGGLDVQLVWYRGHDECSHSAWTADAHELIGQMTRIRCAAGVTQIARVLAHVRDEHRREKVGAAVFIGDAVEERPQDLYDAAAGLDVPAFLFQEGDNPAVFLDQHGRLAEHPSQSVESVLREIARLTGGAWARFDAGAAARLAELLRAVAAFATGGVNSLADLRTDAARKLIAQIRGGAS